MKQKNIVYETTLIPREIDECSKRIGDYLSLCGLSKRDALRYVMSAEEILLESAGKADENTPVILKMGRKFRRTYITIEIGCEAHNVYQSQNENAGLFSTGILHHLGLSPEYSYINDRNIYSFSLQKKKLNPLVKLLISIVTALVVSASGFLLSAPMRQGVLDNLLTPLHDTFLNILGCISGPMVFLSVAWGIYGIGDAATLKRIGKKLLESYMSSVFVSGIFICALCIPFFKLNYSSGTSASSAFSEISGMILGIIPKNIFSPFVDGNTMQIIFLAVVIGIAMLFLGRKTDAVAIIVEQINYIVQLLIEFISGLVPFFVFIVLVKMIWSDMTTVFASSGKMFLIFIIAILIMTWCQIVYSSMRNRIQPFDLIKKTIPGFLIGFTTASSAAAFSANLDICEKSLGIDNNFVSFGLPLGIVTFKPATAVNYIVVSLFFAESYGLDISTAWLLTLVVSACILAIATPPIPGGAMTAYTVLFTQLGIPAEALAVALACDTLFDFADTGIDQLLMPLALLNRGGRLGLVNRDLLTGKKAVKEKANL